MNDLPKTFPVTAHTDHVGPGSTFVAIKGTKEDGVTYIPQALANGATTIVVAKGAQLPDDILSLIQRHGAKIVRVVDTRRALATLSAQALRYPARDLTIIGITGTKGKTTTAFLTEHILRSAGYKTAMLSTVRNRINGVDYQTTLTTQQPDYIHMFLRQCVDQGVTHVVMEVSAQGLSLRRVYGIKFSGVAFTNFEPEHAEFYASVEDYFDAKCLIFKQLQDQAFVIVNADDRGGQRILVDYPTFQGFSVQITQSGREGIGVVIELGGVPYTFFCPTLFGTYNAYNVTAATHLAFSCDVVPEDIDKALRTFPPVPGRMEHYQLPNGALGIIDYAHTPASLRAILTVLKSMSDHIIVVFGCGGDRDATKRPIMGGIAAELADLVILTTDNPRSEDPAVIVQQMYEGVAEHLHQNVILELDREQAIRCAYQHSRSESIIALLGKGPDEYQLVKNIKIPFSERTILKYLA